MRRFLLGPAVLLAAVAVDVACWRGLAADRAATGGRDLDAWLTGAAAWLLSAALTWLVLLVALTLAEPYAGRELATYAGAPPWLRSALLALCGVGVVSVLAGPAQAVPGSHHGDDPAGRAASTTHGVADGLPVPDLPTAGTARTPRSVAATQVVVGPGDSLWLIAERELPAGSGAPAVDAAWHRLYERNRVRIGADPDRIEPGLRLTLPATDRSSHQEER